MDKSISSVLKKTKFKKIAGVLAHFPNEHPDTKPESFCALGILYYQTGDMDKKSKWDELDVRGDFEILKKYYGITREQFRRLYDCPVCGKNEFGLNEFLIHLNDYHDPKNRIENVLPLTFKEIGQILERDGL